ncbi:unnamed protein product [Allacma fusca]|uniref:Uncharacterized protein n=1 Tax=Allacma fusca TaxID=39272 RepID=A0A8J2KMU0_9HEXA|nr:unnamed protein product [Allacma fusca]
MRMYEDELIVVGAEDGKHTSAHNNVLIRATLPEPQKTHRGIEWASAESDREHHYTERASDPRTISTSIRE